MQKMASFQETTSTFDENLCYLKLRGYFFQVFALPKDEMEEQALYWSIVLAAVGLICCVAMIIESWALGISGSRLTERLRTLSFHSMIRQVCKLSLNFSFSHSFSNCLTLENH